MGINVVLLGFVGFNLPVQLGKKKNRETDNTMFSPLSLRLHCFLSIVSVLDPHLHNQYSITSRFINLFFMISIPFTLSLLLYILIFSPECKPNPKTSLTSIRDETE